MSIDLAARFPLTVRYGTVLSDQRWSETQVSGGGGGVLVHGIGVASSRTTSTVTNKREFWVRTDDGREISVEALADKVKVRPGQEVVLVYAQTKRGQVLMRLHNRATGESYLMTHGSHLFGWERWVVAGAVPGSLLGIFILLAGSSVGLLFLLGNAALFPIFGKFKAVNQMTQARLDEAVGGAAALPMANVA